LHKKKKQVKDKGFLMSKYPHDPLIRGSFFKINKEYAKLRKYKKKQFRQQIIDKLDTFQSNNQNEYWNLVNSFSYANLGQTIFHSVFFSFCILIFSLK
jgi:ribosomal protein L20